MSNVSNGSWKEEYNRKLCTPEEAAALIRDNDVICVAGGGNVPDGFCRAFDKRLNQLHNITVAEALAMALFDFITPASAGHSHIETVYGGVVERMCFQWGTAHYIPVHLDDTNRTIEDLDCRIIATAVTLPDENGYFNLSIGRGVLSQRIMEKAEHLIVEVNSHLPWCNSDLLLHVSQVDRIIEKDTPLFQVPDIPITDKEKTIAGYIVDMVPDGATIQIGIGGLPNAIGSFLTSKKDLGIHTEVMTNVFMDLMISGAANGSRKNINKGKAVACLGFGDDRLNKFMDHNQDIMFFAAEYTNDSYVIGQHDNLISINNFMSIDLSGQVGSESKAHQQFTGTGGSVNFVRGAKISNGGKSFLAATATYTQNGEMKSRIMPMLELGTAVTVPRTDVEYIVTEYGIARLRYKSVPKRAKALIQIAHPDFRDQLTFEAKKIGWLY